MIRTDLRKIIVIMTFLSMIFSASLALAAGTSEPLDVNSITIINNAGIPDKVTVMVEAGGVASGDTLKVYADPDLIRLLGKATVAKTATTATVSIKQLGSTAGSVYVTRTGKGCLESDTTQTEYLAETQSEQPSGVNVVISNNTNLPDTVTLGGIAAGDTATFKVYTDSNLKVLLGQAKVNKNDTSATVKIKQLGSIAGNVYVTQTLTVNGLAEAESDATEVFYDAETQSAPPDVNHILIINNSTSNDLIIVYGLMPDDLISIYTDKALNNLLISDSVLTGETQVVLNATLNNSGGNLFLTRTRGGQTVTSSYPNVKKAYSAAQNN